jgi:hypothetical protein
METPKFGKGKCQICGKTLLASETGVGSTCAAHVGKLEAFADHASVAPAGYLGMSKVCRLADAAGIGTRAVVDASGKDACTVAPIHEVFKVVYVGKRKFMNPLVLTTGFDLLRKAQADAKTAKAEKAPVVPGKGHPAPVQADIANALKAVVKPAGK